MFRYLRKLVWRTAPAVDHSITAGTLPANFHRPDSSADKIDQDVNYAIQVSQGYLEQLAFHNKSAANRVILELGPGPNFGSMLVLACHGAKPIVADRFLASWTDDYHIRFYAALRSRIGRDFPHLEVTPISKILRAGAHDPAVITCLPEPGEHLSSIATGSVDIALSNAVLEHLVDPPKVFAELARITRPGGFGVHQVDFRDHRNFSQPLEYLLLDPKAFMTMFSDCHGECGGQWRPHEYSMLFGDSGFDVERFDCNLFADDMYLDSFVPRLRLSENSRYRECSRDQLKAISGLFRVQRRASS